MDKFKCLIRGAYGASNFGDDALLDVIYTKLLSKYSEQEIAICGSNNAYISKWYPNSKAIVKKDLYKCKLYPAKKVRELIKDIYNAS